MKFLSVYCQIILIRQMHYCDGVKSKCLGAGRWQVAKKVGGKEADGK